MSRTATSEAPLRGRPRRTESTEAILNAAVELLDEVGYGTRSPRPGPTAE